MAKYHSKLTGKVTFSFSPTLFSLIVHCSEIRDLGTQGIFPDFG